jgi:hypothetical protein
MSYRLLKRFSGELSGILNWCNPRNALPVQAATFEGKPTPKRKADIQRLLETLAALGQAEEVREGWWGRA